MTKVNKELRTDDNCTDNDKEHDGDDDDDGGDDDGGGGGGGGMNAMTFAHYWGLLSS